MPAKERETAEDMVDRDGGRLGRSGGFAGRGKMELDAEASWITAHARMKTTRFAATKKGRVGENGGNDEKRTSFGRSVAVEQSLLKFNRFGLC